MKETAPPKTIKNTNQHDSMMLAVTEASFHSPCERQARAQQLHQRPSSRAHTAAAPAPKLPRARTTTAQQRHQRSKGTNTQAPTRGGASGQAPTRTQQSRTAAAPAPKLSRAHSSSTQQRRQAPTRTARKLTHAGAPKLPRAHNSRTQQRHQRPSSHTHTAAAYSSGASTRAPTRTQQSHAAAAPAPKLPRARSSTTQQRHQTQAPTRAQQHAQAPTRT